MKCLMEDEVEDEDEVEVERINEVVDDARINIDA